MIFIDTGAFISKFIRKDQFFDISIRSWKELDYSREKCFTSNFVLNETFTLLARKTSYGFSCQRARNIYASEQLEILHPDYQDEIDAITLFGKYSELHVSFTDCISFVLMRKKRIKKAFTFNSHFSMAGYEQWNGYK